MNEIKEDDNDLIVQKYLHKPHLIEGKKFDLRIYVILVGVNPLRVYIYKDGMARFATEFYKKPTDDNVHDLFMHITNYAINKENENYVENNLETANDRPSKRSMEETLEEIRYDVGDEKSKILRFEINDIIIKSLSMATS